MSNLCHQSLIFLYLVGKWLAKFFIVHNFVVHNIWTVFGYTYRMAVVAVPDALQCISNLRIFMFKIWVKFCEIVLNIQNRCNSSQLVAFWCEWQYAFENMKAFKRKPKLSLTPQNDQMKKFRETNRMHATISIAQQRPYSIQYYSTAQLSITFTLHQIGN